MNRREEIRRVRAELAALLEDLRAAVEQLAAALAADEEPESEEGANLA